MKANRLRPVQYPVTAKRLRKLLREHRWLQKELAVLCDKTHSCVAHWVSGLSRPRIEDMERIAQEFNVSVDWLLGREE